MNALRETYAIPALSTVAEPEELEAWMASAEARDRILVAEGRVKPTAALAWMVAANWERLGLASVIAEPRAGGGYRWIAERSAGAGALGDAVAAAARSVSHALRGGRASEPEAPDGTPASDCILRAIKRAANFRHVAPSLTDLAKVAGLKHAAGAKYYVDKLQRRGSIRVDVKQLAGGERRRFQILDTRGHVVAETEWAK